MRARTGRVERASSGRKGIVAMGDCLFSILKIMASISEMVLYVGLPATQQSKKKIAGTFFVGIHVRGKPHINHLLIIYLYDQSYRSIVLHIRADASNVPVSQHVQPHRI